MRPLLLAASLVALLGAPRQELSPFRPNPERVHAPEWRITEDFQNLLAKMQGCWQLVEFFSPMAITAGRSEVAYLTVSQEFAALEFHLGFFSESREGNVLTESYFQSGTFRLSSDNRGALVMMTLIGSAFDAFEQLVYEPPSTLRAFLVSVNADKLVMTRQSDSTRYVFERVKSQLEKDFYGRIVPREGSVLDAPVRKRGQPRSGDGG